jgi:hypothetical protein
MEGKVYPPDAIHDKTAFRPQPAGLLHPSLPPQSTLFG